MAETSYCGDRLIVRRVRNEGDQEQLFAIHGKDENTEPHRNVGAAAVHRYSRILRPRRSPATCATCGLHSAEPRVVHDYLK